jgi:aminoglycoside 6'-N-acetyltransferase I
MNFDITIRAATPADAALWESLRRKLWPDGADDHGPEIAMFFSGHQFKGLTEVLFAEKRDGTTVGYAELSIRNDVPGLIGIPTAYVEGLYVLPESRWRGVGLALLRASRTWAREQRCAAFASDRAGRIVVDRKFLEFAAERG